MVTTIGVSECTFTVYRGMILDTVESVRLHLRIYAAVYQFAGIKCNSKVVHEQRVWGF